MNGLLELELRDGTPVLARPLVPADRDLLAEGYRLLSPEARYQRFWVRTGETIGDAMLDRLLGEKPPGHGIWTVFDPAREGFKALGAASYWRCPETPEEAEFSVTVLDAEQGRGIATALLAILWLTARKYGISRFTGYAAPENVQSLGWMRTTGAAGSWNGYHAVFQWDLAHPENLPETAGELAGRLAEFSGRLG